ncbi:uncharacterized protein K452DRAFT_238726 [Aplosporella prunicola CBS 121167]|uniref:Ribosomal RNA-processing protein 43 n=1 Tax=Aplosporella prunicola CBS 121167 TaxID=1176127 RepID=A0A6A6AZ77_9PEZI|nr:uncharacterized protein K452DRAFT_238726 [Aplosporella prunicola CBS 121167]KAF2135771.1 hypothetical protein K452DRAFT_238726 [Aplosporella prunicola CBS 121167]
MAVETSAPTEPALSFPRDIFAALSPTGFLQAHLTPESDATPTRPNGRPCATGRPPLVNTNTLTHSAGSGVVRLGDTAVVCGLRAEILRLDDVPNPPSGMGDAGPGDDVEGEEEHEDDRAEIEGLGLLVPNIELATGASPAHVPGQPPTAGAQALTARLLAQLHATRVVRARDLRITYTPPPRADMDDYDDDDLPQRQVKAYWTLYLDVLVLSLDGNAFDAAWGAVLAALRNAYMPAARWDPDTAGVVCADAVAEARHLRLRGLPVAASFAVFAGDGRAGKEARQGGEDRAWLLADPDAFEERHCREVVCVVLDCSGGKTALLRVEKHGGGVVDRAALRSVVRLAEGRWREWSVALEWDAPR